MENKLQRMVIGVDPDSAKIATAEYIDGKLDCLFTLLLPDLVYRILGAKEHGREVVVSIENVLANNFVYSRNNQSSKAAQAKVGISIGRCQQSQTELMRWLDHIKVPYVLHRPTRYNWHDNKSLFEKVTGWSKQSNDDTRSAAYFGWLEASKNVSP